mgnify:CR=1 FL=1
MKKIIILILTTIQDEKVDLSSIHWREVETIVAELLRQNGMEIHSVTETPQGERDIIARTQFAPGEAMTRAIEVKHRKLVDRPELHKVIHQNSHFPAMVLIISGRFTAGVLKEVSKSENKMHIFLEDGVANKDMIRNYKL